MGSATKWATGVKLKVKLCLCSDRCCIQKREKVLKEIRNVLNSCFWPISQWICVLILSVQTQVCLHHKNQNSCLKPHHPPRYFQFIDIAFNYHFWPNISYFGGITLISYLQLRQLKVINHIFRGLKLHIFLWWLAIFQRFVQWWIGGNQWSKRRAGF